ncbi:MAG TPA: hypothetical protein VK846_11110 [Candidatus Limnocylindria bacterium]|nr:hypothetical protein [Candidatus Limnocylindria bacterium]
MTATAQPRRAFRSSRRQPVAEPATIAPLSASPPDSLRMLRWLIWSYFLLLLFEGALRKWLLPALANPLLIVRDPVLLAIYALAFARGIFPANRFIIALGVMGVLCFAASFFAEYFSFGVSVFGFRCNFLHLPLIYIIGRVFDFEDVKRVGFWVLLLTLPMTALVVLQFRSAPDSILNTGAGAEAVQITLTGNKVRPSGTFSFISGIIYFYALATAFLIYGLVEKRSYPLWLTAIVGLCVPVALAVSGSRSTVSMTAIVATMFVVAVIIRPALIGKAMKLIAIIASLAFLAGSLAIFRAAFQEGVEAFSTRMKESEHVEGGFEGFVHRITSTFTKPLETMFNVPLLGYGLGVGTNVGAKLLTGQTDFFLAEDEWERVMCESGALLGGIYVLIRVLMTLQLGAMAARAARIGHFLPLLLFGACAVPLVAGQFGQSTTLGFAVFVSGLCLAAMHLPNALAAAVVAAKQPERVRPAKVVALRAAIAAKRAAARGTGWTKKLMEPSP